MAQWFKKLRLMFLRLLGAKPYSMGLAIAGLDETIQKGALTIHKYYHDEGVRSVLHIMKAQQTRGMYSMASFKGDTVALARLQGQLDTVTGLIEFIEQAGNMAPDETAKLKEEKRDLNKKQILRFATKSHNEVVI